MKLFNILFISSLLFFTVSCNDDSYSFEDESATETEVRRGGSNGGATNGTPSTQFANQLLLELETGEWTPHGCNTDGVQRYVFDNVNDCLCKKYEILNALGDNDCHNIIKLCSSTNRLVDTYCP